MEESHRGVVNIPLNNSITLRNEAIEGHDDMYKPNLRGGAIEYNVDLSSVGCGCVAGLYAVFVDDYCNADNNIKSDRPHCPSIDIM